MGTPNSAVMSEATVFASRSQAASYYGALLSALPACAHRAIGTRHPGRIWNAEHLVLGPYGVQSGAWRIRYTTGAYRHGFDWALVNTGTGVLVDVFDMGIYDSHWHDMSAARGLGGSVPDIERRVLANATRRAATA